MHIFKITFRSLNCFVMVKHYDNILMFIKLKSHIYFRTQQNCSFKNKILSLSFVFSTFSLNLLYVTTFICMYVCMCFVEFLFLCILILTRSSVQVQN